MLLFVILQFKISKKGAFDCQIWRFEYFNFGVNLPRRWNINPFQHNIMISGLSMAIHRLKCLRRK